MQPSLEDIRKPIENELRIFEEKFRLAMKSKTPLLDTIMNYIVKQKGKKVRPMFVFLSASVCGQISESTYRGASLIELLHTATLVHDDVVDDADERRGFFSINAIWKNKIAVLVGDYLLSKGLLLSVGNKDFRLLEIVSNAVREMSEGELLQIEKTRKLNISEEIYFEIIRQKTASLISSACAVGAASSGASEKEIEMMRLFGEKVGIAFQIKDDLLDLGNDDTGKPHGLDLKEKKITLPLIFTLNNCTSAERKKIVSIIKNHSKEPDKVEDLIEMIKEKKGISYASEKMNQYKDEAINIINQFAETPARDSLSRLVLFTTERKK
ncbi:MAG TPA: polyprenyl synthetase [Bacteroidetes bacterium]|nr:polyprenyl synthetase [Bacteroidota bacterium]